MKEITLKFREVAVDGLPTESMDHAITIDKLGVNLLPYSSVHEMWNCYDYQKPSIARATGLTFSDVTHWCPCSEIESNFKEDSTNAD